MVKSSFSMTWIPVRPVVVKMVKIIITCFFTVQMAAAAMAEGFQKCIIAAI